MYTKTTKKQGKQRVSGQQKLRDRKQRHDRKVQKKLILKNENIKMEEKEMMNRTGKMEEKKMMNRKYHVSREEQQVNEIKNLYEKMVCSENTERTLREKLAADLLKMQKEDGSWRVVESLQIESDCVIYYAFFPTYYATAALICHMNRDRKVSNQVFEALENGLEFAARIHLRGHGYDGTGQQLEALGIYKKAGLYPWLREKAALYPAFAGMIKDIIDKYRLNYYSGNTYSDWNVNFADAFKKEVDEYESMVNPSVWYAAYGSNVNSERFARYINSCTDRTMPADSKKCLIPYNIYFAYRSSKWGRKGVAFLDDTETGSAFGKMYRVTAEQFAEIQRMEGRIYARKIFLGMEDDAPIYSITAPEKRTDITEPSAQYLDTICKGLCETYPDKSEEVFRLYLFGCGVLDKGDRTLLFTLRNSEHGLTLRELADLDFQGGITKTRKSIKKLNMYHWIKQDRRSAAEGCSLTSENAVIYTVKAKRNLIDFLLLDVRYN